MKITSAVMCRFVGAAIVALVLGLSQCASAAQIIAVDYDGTAGDTPSTTPVTQSGFTSVTSDGPVTLPGGYGLTTTPSFAGGGGSGFYTRSGVTNSGSFTEAALYEDFFYSQNNSFSGNPSATIEVSGLHAGVPYTFTFYTYDASATIGGANPSQTFTTSFTPIGSTSGSGPSANYVAGQNPTVNEQYTSTGTYTSTTSTIDIVAQIASNNDFLRINGFTVSAPVPEPSALVLLGLGSLALAQIARRRRA